MEFSISKCFALPISGNVAHEKVGTVDSVELQHLGIPITFVVTVFFITFAFCTVAMSRCPLGDKHNLFSGTFGHFLECLSS